MSACPNLYTFGVGVNAPGSAVAGPATFQDTIAVSRADEVGIVSMVACFYNTAFARAESGTVELDFQPPGVRYTVAPTAPSVEQLPIFEGLVLGRQVVSFPVPLAVPPASNGSGLRQEVRVLLTGISANCAFWRVFVQTAVRKNGVWVY